MVSGTEIVFTYIAYKFFCSVSGANLWRLLDRLAWDSKLEYTI
jgi:hypothetical protein